MPPCTTFQLAAVFVFLISYLAEAAKGKKMNFIQLHVRACLSENQITLVLKNSQANYNNQVPILPRLTSRDDNYRTKLLYNGLLRLLEQNVMFIITVLFSVVLST